MTRAHALDLGQVGDVRRVVGLGAGRGGEPGVEDLAELRLRGRAQAEREHVRVVPARARPRRSARRRTAPRGPRATLLAAIDAPVPVQQQTTACSARPSATSRAAASTHHAQSSRSPSASAPCSDGSWPRRRSSSTTASATPFRSSAATAMRMGSGCTRRRTAACARRPARCISARATSPPFRVTRNDGKEGAHVSHIRRAARQDRQPRMGCGPHRGGARGRLPCSTRAIARSASSRGSSTPS